MGVLIEDVEAGPSRLDADTIISQHEQEILLHAWNLGRGYERNLISSVADDIGRVIDPPALSYEERVAGRMAAMERLAITDHHGGPVAPW